MNGISDSAVTSLFGRIFPRTPDFYGQMKERCDALMDVIDGFVQYMEEISEGDATTARKTEKGGNELKTGNTGVLNRLFTRHMDRDGVYRAIFTLDLLIDHAKTTGREMDELEVKPEEFMMQITAEFRRGVHALQEGFRKLTTNPEQAQEDVSTARKAGLNMRQMYRHALAELFEDDKMLKKLDAGESATKARTQAMHGVLEKIRHREIYRQLSNGTDGLTWATNSLQDNIVAIS